MSFTESIRTCFSKYGVAIGRARRSEYWWFQLYQAIIYVLSLVFQSDLALLFSILVIANLLPLYACGVRRIHDSDKSGWFILLSLIPIIGALASKARSITRRIFFATISPRLPPIIEKSSE